MNPYLIMLAAAALMRVVLALSDGSNEAKLATAAATEARASSAARAPASEPALPSFGLDPVHSAALFRIQHLQAGQFWGRINALSGTVAYADDDSAAPQFDVTASLANIDTGSDKLDKNLQGPNFFNALEFPELRFRSTGGTRAGTSRWRVTGEMTIHGVTQIIEVEVEVTGIGLGPTGRKAGFEATAEIQRSAFGMNWGIEKPPRMLGDSVRLIISLEGDEAKVAP